MGTWVINAIETIGTFNFSHWLIWKLKVKWREKEILRCKKMGKQWTLALWSQHKFINWQRQRNVLKEREWVGIWFDSMIDHNKLYRNLNFSAAICFHFQRNAHKHTHMSRKRSPHLRIHLENMKHTMPMDTYNYFMSNVITKTKLSDAIKLLCVEALSSIFLFLHQFDLLLLLLGIFWTIFSFYCLLSIVVDI